MSESYDDTGNLPEDTNYETKVGYCQPPLETRWKKGFCPNPRGRPRKKHTRKFYLERAAYRKIRARDGQRWRKMTVLEAIILIIKAKAATNHAAASKLDDRLRGLHLRVFEPGKPRATAFFGEKLDIDEWMEKYGHLGDG